MDRTSKGTAFITGASGGIGAAFAGELAARGYDLNLVARREDKLRELCGELAARHGVRTQYVVADLNNEADLARVVEAVRATPQLSMLINNAGFGTTGTFEEVDVEKHTAMAALHDLVAIRLTYAAIPALKQTHGAIINLSSVSSFFPAPERVTYGATKAFLNSFSASLQIELADFGVRVQALCPGLTYTEFHDRPDFSGFDRNTVPKILWMTAEDVVRLSLDALSKGKVICIPGWRNRVMVRLASFGALFRRARQLYQSRNRGVEK